MSFFVIIAEFLLQKNIVSTTTTTTKTTFEKFQHSQCLCVLQIENVFCHEQHWKMKKKSMLLNIDICVKNRIEKNCQKQMDRSLTFFFSLSIDLDDMNYIRKEFTFI